MASKLVIERPLHLVLGCFNCSKQRQPPRTAGQPPVEFWSCPLFTLVMFVQYLFTEILFLDPTAFENYSRENKFQSSAMNPAMNSTLIRDWIRLIKENVVTAELNYCKLDCSSIYSLACLWWESNFWLQCTQCLPCAGVFAGVYACVIAYLLYMYVSLRANNATYAHAQGKWPGALKPKSYSLIKGNRTTVIKGHRSLITNQDVMCHAVPLRTTVWMVIIAPWEI